MAMIFQFFFCCKSQVWFLPKQSELIFFLHMRISSLFVDFCLTYVPVFQGSPQGGSQHELGGLVWEDVEGQEFFLSVLDLNSQLRDY